MQCYFDHIHLGADTAAMNRNRKSKSHIEQLIHIKQYKKLFVLLRMYFNTQPSSSLSKLKIPTPTNYDIMTIQKNDNVQ